MAQKSLIAIVQTVAAELNLPQPTQIVSSQDQNIQKMLALARAVSDDLLAEFDWQNLQTRYSFSTTNGVESYAFPTDIERFIGGTFFDANNRYPMWGPKTPAEWEYLKASSFVGTPFTQFRVYGDKFYISPVPGTSTFTFNFEYISKNYVLDNSSGLTKPDYTVDSDICRFDHRVMVYGIKLKWKESIGQDTGSNLTDYKRALEAAKGTDQPATTINLLGSAGFRPLSTANYTDGSWS